MSVKWFLKLHLILQEVIVVTFHFGERLFDKNDACPTLPKGRVVICGSDKHELTP